MALLISTNMYKAEEFKRVLPYVEKWRGQVGVEVFPMFRQHIFDKVSTNKTGSPGNQISLHRPYYLYVKLYSASLKRGAFVSFSDKVRVSVSEILQSTPIEGSSKRSPLS